jgi:hypothetical protein
MTKNPHARALGKLARGVPKRFSPAEIQRRRERMEKINERKRKVKQ